MDSILRLEAEWECLSVCEGLQQLDPCFGSLMIEDYGIWGGVYRGPRLLNMKTHVKQPS